jgi:hypothetical protein
VADPLSLSAGDRPGQLLGFYRRSRLVQCLQRTDGSFPRMPALSHESCLSTANRLLFLPVFRDAFSGWLWGSQTPEVPAQS